MEISFDRNELNLKWFPLFTFISNCIKDEGIWISKWYEGRKFNQLLALLTKKFRMLEFRNIIILKFVSREINAEESMAVQAVGDEKANETDKQTLIFTIALIVYTPKMIPTLSDAVLKVWKNIFATWRCLRWKFYPTVQTPPQRYKNVIFDRLNFDLRVVAFAETQILSFEKMNTSCIQNHIQNVL